MNTDDWFKAFFYKHYAELCHKAFRLIHDKDTCEDIVQECFINLWNRQNEIRHDNLENYLSMAVRNSCISYLRQSHDTVSIDGEDALIKLSDLIEEDHHEKPPIEETIERAMSELPERCREVFRMSRLENKSYMEIAEELRLSVKTVENQMGKAIKIMRQFVQKHPELFCLIGFLIK